MKKLIEYYPEIAKQWHPSKNENFILEKLTCGSKKKVWWVCPNGHEYEARVDSRIDCTGRKGYGCPYCGRKKKGLLSETHPNLVLEWHPRNILKPGEITSGSHEKVWWLGKCGHEWQAFVHNRTCHQANGCPFCSHKFVDETNCLLKNFPEIAEEWHPTKNVLSPSEVSWKTYKKVWWLGKCGHEWQALVRTRTRKVRPTGCPICQESKGEVAVAKTLDKLNINYKKQVRFTECRDKKPLPFDFHIIDQKILIEYQGLQHYEPVNFGGDYIQEFESIKKRDSIKLSWCVKNGYKLVLIPYWQKDNIQNIIEREVYHPQTDRGRS